MHDKHDMQAECAETGVMTRRPSTQGLGIGEPLSPEQVDIVLEALRGGATMLAAASEIGVCRLTLYRRANADEALGDAIREAQQAGRAAQIDRIEESVFKGAEKCHEDPRYFHHARFSLVSHAADRGWDDRSGVDVRGGVSVDHRGQVDLLLVQALAAERKRIEKAEQAALPGPADNTPSNED